MTRDLLKDEVWLNKWTNFEESALSDRLSIIATPAVNRLYEPQYLKDTGFHNIRLLLLRYSRGDNMEELSQYFEPLLHYWEESERLGKGVWTPEQWRIRHTWSVNLDFFIDCFWVIGLALALEIPDQQWQRLVALIGNEGEDALLDKIIATRSPLRKIGQSLCYPKPYGRLLDALYADPSARPRLLSKFVENWYKEIGSAAKSGREKKAVPFKAPYWYNYHRVDGGYFGYWCLEAVAAVKAFGLDDSLCLGHPNYPGDLLRPGAVTVSDIRRLPAELVSAIGAEPDPPFLGVPKKITNWEAFKLAVKNISKN